MKEDGMRTRMLMGIAAALAMGLAARPVAATPLQLAAEHKATEAKDADDSGRNVRDRDKNALTPMEQGGSKGDRTITQDIRKQIVNDDALSVNAKNVKVITVDGVVTLRGPVKSQDEKTKVADIARRASGVKRVDDQLEVERKP